MSRIQLTTDCPAIARCGMKNLEWHREACNHRTYIDTDGDLSCEQKCSNPNTYYFIQQARFKCGSSTHESYVKFESLNELIMQLATVVSGLTLYGDSDPNFMTNMLQNVKTKWKK